MSSRNTRRITITVDAEIDAIRNRVFEDTGVFMTYRQLVDFLVTAYVKTTKPKTSWKK